jgi:hypothetical protein
LCVGRDPDLRTEEKTKQVLLRSENARTKTEKKAILDELSLHPVESHLYGLLTGSDKPWELEPYGTAVTANMHTITEGVLKKTIKSCVLAMTQAQKANLVLMYDKICEKAPFQGWHPADLFYKYSTSSKGTRAGLSANQLEAHTYILPFVYVDSPCHDLAQGFGFFAAGVEASSSAFKTCIGLEVVRTRKERTHHRVTT